MIAVMIVWSSMDIVRESLRIFMQGAPAGIDTDAVYQGLMALPGVGGVHGLHIWSISSSEVFLSCHLRTLPEEPVIPTRLSAERTPCWNAISASPTPPYRLSARCRAEVVVAEVSPVRRGPTPRRVLCLFFLRLRLCLRHETTCPHYHLLRVFALSLAGVLSAQPEEAAQPEGAFRHDGLFLRFQTGFGLGGWWKRTSAGATSR